MTLHAVVFDIGGVLERVGPTDWLSIWADRLGRSLSDVEAAFDRVDPEGRAATGELDEPALRRGCARELGLPADLVDAFMGDLWDWYCGTPDEELLRYLRELRLRVLTGILSNSVDGARREEERRYALPELVDVLVYSHEVGLAKPDPAVYRLTCDRLGVRPAEAVLVDDVAVNVDGARAVGMHAVLHEETARTITVLEQLLVGAGPRQAARRSGGQAQSAVCSAPEQAAAATTGDGGKTQRR